MSSRLTRLRLDFNFDALSFLRLAYMCVVILCYYAETVEEKKGNIKRREWEFIGASSFLLTHCTSFLEHHLILTGFRL